MKDILGLVLAVAALLFAIYYCIVVIKEDGHDNT